MEPKLPAQKDGSIWFCATSKTGLGHLRRCTSIAQSINQLDPSLGLGLMTNSTCENLYDFGLPIFANNTFVTRQEMAGNLSGASKYPVVIDTAILPGVETIERPLILILRETPDNLISGFNMSSNRQWDLVIVPNPEAHWLPSAKLINARDIKAVGWIYRKTEISQFTSNDKPTVLVATGGGGSRDTASKIKKIVDKIIRNARSNLSKNFVVKQAAGPKMPECGILESADIVFNPGGKLNSNFEKADIVISTAGYNSVLELADIGCPTLLIPIPRSIDDQEQRVSVWGDLLGHGFDGNYTSAANWLCSMLVQKNGRNRIDLGPSGQKIAAKLIVEMSK